jgi:hypothetical protein
MRHPLVYQALTALPPTRRRLDTVYGPVGGDAPRCVFGELCPETRGGEGHITMLALEKAEVGLALDGLGLSFPEAHLLQLTNDKFPSWRDVHRYKTEEEIRCARYDHLLAYAAGTEEPH